MNRASLRFWRIYATSSALSVAVALFIFHIVETRLSGSYEAGTISGGLFAMPINWLVGEQLAWIHGRLRTIRALRYFFVYSVGLAIEVTGVHAFGHILKLPAFEANMLATVVSFSWTVPMNRYLTWAQDVVRLRAGAG